MRLTAIEFSPEMLKLARQRAAEVDAEVDLRPGDAQALELGDESFDTVICTLALCTNPGPGGGQGGVPPGCGLTT
jgi:ubiquinone/menaquinone biosynthesis C-methylase UbiE